MVDRLGRHTIAWAQRQGLLPTAQARARLLNERHWQLMARAYPTTDFLYLALVTDWNTWGFALDDVADTSGVGRDPTKQRRLAGAIRDALAEGDCFTDTASPLVGAVADIWRRVVPLSTPAWREDLRQTLQLSFVANNWEAINRAEGITPRRDSYLRMRIYTGAWLTYVRFMELFERVALPPAVAAHPTLQAYLGAVNNTIVWANDLLSWRKEQAQSDTHNLVFIVQAEEGCTVPEAMRRVVGYHNDEVRRCLALECEVLAIAPAYANALARYIQFAHHFMRANLDWSLESGRYDTSAITVSATPTPAARRLSMPPVPDAQPPHGIGDVVAAAATAVWAWWHHDAPQSVPLFRSR